MTDSIPDIDLEALFALDPPPAHDGVFVIAVAMRAARRRLAVEIAYGAVVAALSALVLWAIGPVLGPVLLPALAGVGRLLMLAAPALAVAAAALLMSGLRAVL